MMYYVFYEVNLMVNSSRVLQCAVHIPVVITNTRIYVLEAL